MQLSTASSVGPAPLLDRSQHVPAEIRRILGVLDERLIRVLRRLSVRLVRSEWVLAQPVDFRMVRRQELEVMEGNDWAHRCSPQPRQSL